MPGLPTGTVTFLFTDIEGSTRRWERVPDAMRPALARHDALLREAITRAGGAVFKTVGDAFCAAFAEPGAALAAALAAQRALASEAWGEAGPLCVRMALHTGQAEERDADYFGPTVNRVARLLSTGYGEQILLSRATADLVRDALPPGATLRDLGGHRLKDLARPEHIFQLLAPDLAADFPPLKSLDAHPNNLPSQLTPLIGREAEVSRLRSLLTAEGARLVTLTGPGGTGKTRLGLAVAAEVTETFADGVWFVDLSVVREPGLVVPEVARTLGIREEGTQPPLARLTEALRDEHSLLLLDNLEQVTAAAPDIAALVAACPGISILATSRMSLRVRGEQTVAVAPLALPDTQRLPALPDLATIPAVRLFMARAQDAKPGFALNAGNAPDVAAICRRLEGLPLAIELAAARVRLLAPSTLLARLEQRLPLLAGGARDLPARQQTMRAAIAWSYDLLDPPAQACFRTLAVFAGGCTLAAADAVWTNRTVVGDEVAGLALAPTMASLEALDAVGALVEGSLLREVEQEGDEPRFAMLETIREFGLERLAAAGEAAAIQQSHAEYFLALAEAAEPALMGPAAESWLARLEAEHDNVRAALAWALEQPATTVGLRLATALRQFWGIRGHVREGRAWLERAVQQGGPDAAAWRAKAFRGAGVLARNQGDYARATELYEAGLALFRELGDQRGVAITLNNLGVLAQDQHDYAQATALYEESLRLERQLGNEHGAALSLGNLGLVAADQGDLGRATALYEACLALFRALGDQDGIATTLGNLGNVAQAQGEDARAVALYEESLALSRALGNKAAIALMLSNLGSVAQAQGDYARAARLYAESLVLRRELGETPRIAPSLEGVAAAIARQQPARAVRLFAAAAARRQASGEALLPDEREDQERHLTAIRQHLSPETFAAAWAAGQTMPLERAIDEALAAPIGAAHLATPSGAYPPSP